MASFPDDTAAASSASGYSHQGSPTLLELLVTLSRHKRLLIAFPLACSLIAALVALSLPNIYTATARLLPPEQGPSPVAAAIIGQISGLNSTSNSISQSLGLQNASDLYVGLLRSRTIADALIQRFQLRKVYDTQLTSEARKVLANRSDITADQDGIISIRVEDDVPTRAAAMANAYVEQLEQLTKRVAITSASRQRLFLQQQLAQVKTHLTDAEDSLRTTQEKTGLISLPEQGKATIEAIASLRAQIASKKVQLAAMGIAMTEGNPNYMRTQEEILHLEKELSRLVENAPVNSKDIIPPAGQIPDTSLKVIRKLRDVRYYQTLFELIAKQYEIARSQEAANGALIQVLDRAVVPDKKSRPRRSMIVVVTGLLTGVLGIFIALALSAIERAKKDPEQSSLIEELRENLRLGHR